MYVMPHVFQMSILRLLVLHAADMVNERTRLVSVPSHDHHHIMMDWCMFRRHDSMFHDDDIDWERGIWYTNNTIYEALKYVA